jgi:hypothetical protein
MSHKKNQEEAARWLTTGQDEPNKETNMEQSTQNEADKDK